MFEHSAAVVGPDAAAALEGALPQEIPVVDITTSWFAGLRRQSRYTLTVTSPQGEVIERSVHASHRDALDAAVAVCRKLRRRMPSMHLAA